MDDGYTYPTGLTQRELYEQLHAEGAYGCGSHGNGTEEFLKGCASLLDVGAGRSHYAEVMKAKAGLKRVVVTDISANACKWQITKGAMALQCDVLEGLPFDNYSFDAVTCFDCLEHLPEERLTAVLCELRRVAIKVLIITVPEIQANATGPDGELLHLTVRPLAWWLELIETTLERRAKVHRFIQRYRGGNRKLPRWSDCIVVKL
jgi:ubiquinone/menaquinone biosynthesis C-methylase UbiE